MHAISKTSVSEKPVELDPLADALRRRRVVVPTWVAEAGAYDQRSATMRSENGLFNQTRACRFAVHFLIYAVICLGVWILARF